MNREVVLGLLVLLVCGPAVWLFGAVPDRIGTEASGRRLERQYRTAISLRLLPGGAALAALAGWAIQEPQATDETLLPWVVIVLAPIVAIWTRGLLRAALALLPAASTSPAATVGLVRPRVVLGPELVQCLAPQVLRAVQQHEEAHVRHRDPLRIWLTQLATDLQWPWPVAQARLRDWLYALELARDEEARVLGVDGLDLASAVLAVAKLQKRGGSETARAHLTGDGEALQVRVARLLSPVPSESLRGGERRWFLLATALGLFAATFLFGLLDGESMVRALPGVIVRSVREGARFVALFA